MRKYIVLFVFVWALRAEAATYIYTINNAGDTVTTAAGSSNGVGATAVSLEAAQAAHGGQSAWAAGDSITLTPNGDVAYPSADLNLNDGNSGSTWFTFDGGNSLISGNPSGVAAAGIIQITKSGTIVKNCRLKHTATPTGPAINIRASAASIVGFIVQDVTVLQPAAYSGYNSSPYINVRQEGPTSGFTATGSFVRVVCEQDATVNKNPICNTQDITAGGSNAARGRIYFIDCRMGGILVDATDGADDVLGCAAAADVFVVGGIYHDSEAACITQEGGTPSAACVYAYGVETYRDNVRTSYDATASSITATVVDSCYIHDALEGVAIDQYTIDYGGTVRQKLGVVRNCLLVRDKSRAASSSTIDHNAITTYTSNVIIDGNVIDGWGQNLSGGGIEYGVVRLGTVATVRGGSLTIRNNWFKGTQHCIDAESRCTYLDIDSNLWTFAGATTNRKAVFAWLTNETSNRPETHRFVNNVISHAPADDNGSSYVIATSASANKEITPAGSAAASVLCGYNYWYYNTNTEGFSAYTTDTATDTATQTAANAPVIDTMGRVVGPTAILTQGRSDYEGAAPSDVAKYNFALATTVKLDDDQNNTAENSTADGSWLPNKWLLMGTISATLAAANSDYRGMTLVLWTDKTAADGVADNVQYARIIGAAVASGRVYVKLAVPVVGLTASSTADTVYGMVVPPLWPRNMNLTNMVADYSFEGQPSSFAFPKDILGRYLTPKGIENVAITDATLTVGRRTPGPWALTPSKNDWRRNALRGWYPGKVDPMVNLRDK